jgi:hypothetical protein
MQVWLAAAAVLLFAVAGWLWQQTRSSPQTTDTAVLDLRERSAVRGQNPTEIAQPPLQIPRTAKHLVLDLPIGSKEGSYDVVLLNDAGQHILRAAGTARLENHTVILRADVDLASVRPGSYSLGVRQLGLEWTQFRASVN